MNFSIAELMFVAPEPIFSYNISLVVKIAFVCGVFLGIIFGLEKENVGCKAVRLSTWGFFLSLLACLIIFASLLIFYSIEDVFYLWLLSCVFLYILAGLIFSFFLLDFIFNQKRKNIVVLKIRSILLWSFPETIKNWRGK